MNTLTVALLQMTAARNIDDAMTKGADFCRRAKALGADVALFPEMWSSGYRFHLSWEQDALNGDAWRAPARWTAAAPPPPHDPWALARWADQAVGLDDPYVVFFRDLARDLDLAIALTYLEKWPGRPRNTVSLIDRHGAVVLTYAKVHTCAFGLEGACTPGDAFYTATLNTAHGPVEVGTMICYDREFPESARILMLQGAEVVLVPNACEMEENRRGQLRARAFENMMGVALTNYAGRDGGRSVAFDAVAFGTDGRSRDTTLVQAGADEGVYLASFDLDALRDYRTRETWGAAFRRPASYGVLTSGDVPETFVRVDAAGVRFQG